MKNKICINKPICPASKLVFLVFFILCFISSLPAQVQNVPSEHPIYPFLKRMEVQGIIKNYNDVILPLSKEKIIDFLVQLDSAKGKLSAADLEFYYRMREKFQPEERLSLFDDLSEFTSRQHKNLYGYRDSLVNFTVNPLVEYSYLNSNGSASLFNFGGKAYGSYDGWLGFYVQATNGMQWGDRETARIEPAVAQSFTFNHTGLNYYDGTRGYLRLAKGIASIQIGRERILWGTGYINRLFLSDNPPLFDFVKFDIGYKSLNYSFIHGWLVGKTDTLYRDSLRGTIKQKTPKYFAISRFSYTPLSNLSFGVSQVIVYSRRPFEAAYMNPFMFWESAQRSMNDHDNSMLSFDGRWLIANGLEVSGTLLFDDLDFRNISEGGWIDNTNGSAWQTGAYITSPVLPAGMSARLEYMQIRPYMFSHPGIEESLTYTSNGYMLGTGIQPNSILISAALDYSVSGYLNCSIGYSRYLHGENIYDKNGNLVRNVGGNVFENLSVYDSQRAFLLDGIRKTTDEVLFKLNFEAFYGVYFDLMYSYRNGPEDNKNIFRANLKLDFE